MIKHGLIYVILCFAVVISEFVPNRYDSFKVFRVRVPNEASANVIMEDLQYHVDIWSEPRIGHHSDLMVSPTNLKAVVKKLKETSLEYSVMIDNVQTLLDREKGNVNKNSVDLRSNNIGHPMTWNNYHSLNDMDLYMDYLVKQFPNVVSIENIGTSYEGRKMKVLKICQDGVCGKNPGIFINGGIHAREWIGPSTVTFIIKELLENDHKYPTEILDKLDWYILPVLNPDGYEYSRTFDRMWRKNRYTVSINKKA